MKHPLRIALLHPNLGIGGAERLIIDAALCLQNAGHHIVIFTTHHDRERCFEETLDGRLNIEVHGAPLPEHFMQRLRAPLAIARMHYLARFVAAQTNPFDIIFVDLIAHILPLLQRRVPRAKLVFYCHFPDELLTHKSNIIYSLYRRPIDRLEMRGMQCAARIFANSQYTRRIVQQTYPQLAEDKIKVLYPGVNLDNFYQNSCKPQTGHNIPPASFVILSIARFSPEKNLFLLVEALQALRAQLPDSDFQRCFLILAGGYDGNHISNVNTYNDLQALIDKHGFNGRVSLLRSPESATLKQLLRRCNCVVYSPVGEHFGLVPIEAMAAGKPVIASNSGGPVETIVHGESGFLCEPTPSAFARTIATLLQNPLECKRIGNNARLRADAFSMNAFAHNLNNELDQLMELTGTEQ